MLFAWKRGAFPPFVFYYKFFIGTEDMGSVHRKYGGSPGKAPLR